MTDWVTLMLPFATVALALASYFIGIRVRDAAHCMVPLNDPVSVTLLTVSCIMPVLMWTLFDVPFSSDVWIQYASLAVGFWGGYMIGYCSVGADVVYISVHDIVERTQDVYPIVRYRNREGRQCWQPQSFRKICRSMIFHIDNPLDLSAVQRTRHVTCKQAYHMVNEADAIDVAGMQVEEYDRKLWRFNCRIESRHYTPVPYCTDAPYDWILNANKYEDLFTEYARLQTSAIDSAAELNVAMVKGGGLALSAMASKNPDELFMRELGIRLEDMVSDRAKEKRAAKRRAMEEADE